jgi:hypothetical protein
MAPGAFACGCVAGAHGSDCRAEELARAGDVSTPDAELRRRLTTLTEDLTPDEGAAFVRAAEQVLSVWYGVWVLTKPLRRTSVRDRPSEHLVTGYATSLCHDNVDDPNYHYDHLITMLDRVASGHLDGADSIADVKDQRPQDILPGLAHETQLLMDMTLVAIREAAECVQAEQKTRDVAQRLAAEAKLKFKTQEAPKKVEKGASENKSALGEKKPRRTMWADMMKLFPEFQSNFPESNALTTKSSITGGILLTAKPGEKSGMTEIFTQITDRFVPIYTVGAAGDDKAVQLYEPQPIFGDLGSALMGHSVKSGAQDDSKGLFSDRYDCLLPQATEFHHRMNAIEKYWARVYLEASALEVCTNMHFVMSIKGRSNTGKLRVPTAAKDDFNAVQDMMETLRGARMRVASECFLGIDPNDHRVLARYPVPAGWDTVSCSFDKLVYLLSTFGAVVELYMGTALDLTACEEGGVPKDFTLHCGRPGCDHDIPYHGFASREALLTHMTVVHGGVPPAPHNPTSYHDTTMKCVHPHCQEKRNMPFWGFKGPAAKTNLGKHLVHAHTQWLNTEQFREALAAVAAGAPAAGAEEGKVLTMDVNEIKDGEFTARELAARLHLTSRAWEYQRDCLFFDTFYYCFLRTIKSGNGHALLGTYYRYLMVIAHSQNNVHIRDATIYTALEQEALFTPRAAYRAMFGRFVSYFGGPGSNISVDLCNEFFNKVVQPLLKRLGEGITPAKARAVVQSAYAGARVLEAFKQGAGFFESARGRKRVHLEEDREKVASLLRENHAMFPTPGEVYRTFPDADSRFAGAIPKGELEQKIAGHIEDLAERQRLDVARRKHMRSRVAHALAGSQ